MRLVLLTLMMIQLANSMPDNISFVKETQPTLAAKIIIEESSRETERACQVACGARTECTAISYSFPACRLFADSNDGTVCTRAISVSTKKDVVIARTNMGAEMGNDICAAGFFPANLTATPANICVRDSKNLVIRAVNETGSRVTFDNDWSNTLTFDSVRNMWKFAYPSSGFERWVVAVACAVPKATCDCAPLPMIDDQVWLASQAIVGAVDALIGGPGSCANASHYLTYKDAKRPADKPKTFGLPIAAIYSITCAAGIWLLGQPGQNTWQITHATCSPPFLPK